MFLVVVIDDEAEKIGSEQNEMRNKESGMDVSISTLTDSLLSSIRPQPVVSFFLFQIDPIVSTKWRGDGPFVCCFRMIRCIVQDRTLR